MKNLELKILENEYRRKKIFPTGTGKEKEYLERLRFQINLNHDKSLDMNIKDKYLT